MKKTSIKIITLLMLLSVVSMFAFNRKKTELPASYNGNWKCTQTKITQREKVKFMKYKFYPDVVSVNLSIDQSGRAKGNIGNAHFENAEVTKNKGSVKITGIIGIVKCELKGRISGSSAIQTHKVEFWIRPMNDNGKMVAELRLKDAADAFPMGEITFTR